MRPIRLAGGDADPLRVLFIGAHSDDIEIGCGGTILTLVRSRANLVVHWLVLSATAERDVEARGAAERFLGGVSTRTVSIERFRDGYLPYEGGRVKDYFEALKARVDPDVIFTHYREDWHQDHRFVSEVTWSTFRRHLILEYEIPKYDAERPEAPNLFVPIDAAAAERKVDLILTAYASQASRPWFTRDVFLGTMRLRGVQARAPFAEAFYARKLLLESPGDAGS